MSSSVHNVWPTCRLGDHAAVRGRIGWKGLKSEEYTDEGPYLIAGNHILGDKIQWDKCQHVNLFRYDESPEIKLQVGDVIISKDGTIGRVAFIDRLPGPTTINSTMMLIRLASRSDLEPHYVFYSLQGEEFKKLVSERVSGSGVPHLFQADMKELVISKPEINEQRKIAKILSTVDNLIEKTQALIDKYQSIKQGMMHDLFTRGADENGQLRPSYEEAPHLYKESELGWIPKEWDVKRLEDVSSVDRGKFGHRPRNDPRFYGGEYPFIQTGDVTGNVGGVLTQFSQTLNDRGVAVSREFPEGSIAVTIAANIADTTILGMPMFFPDSLVGVVVNKGCNIRFIELCIRRTKRTLDALAPQSAQKNINLEDLRPLKIPFPDSLEQSRISGFYENLHRKITCEEAYLVKLKITKMGLMQDLLTGKVRVKVDA